jgi:phosphate transport system protein
MEVRIHYQEELESLERRSLEGLDMVDETLGRTVEAIQHQDTELAQLVDRKSVV